MSPCDTCKHKDSWKYDGDPCRGCVGFGLHDAFTEATKENFSTSKKDRLPRSAEAQVAKVSHLGQIVQQLARKFNHRVRKAR